MSVQRHGLGNAVEHIAHQFGHPGLGGDARLARLVEQQEHELVATETGHGITGAHAVLQARGDHLQQPVAEFMSQVIVDQLEIVKIDESNDQAVAMQSRVPYGLVHAVQQQATVGQAGERVELCLVHQLLGVIAGVRHIIKDGHIMFRSPVAAIAHRGNVDFIPKRPAILAIAAHHGVRLAPLAQRQPQFVQAWLIEVIAGEEIRFHAQRITRAVAADTHKGRIDVFDREAGPSAVRDDDGVEARSHGALAQAQGLVGAQQLVRPALQARLGGSQGRTHRVEDRGQFTDLIARMGSDGNIAPALRQLARSLSEFLKRPGHAARNITGAAQRQHQAEQRDHCHHLERVAGLGR